MPSLYDLYHTHRFVSSNLIFYDVNSKRSISFSELHDGVCCISNLLERLSLTQCVICVLSKPGLSLPALILGILKVHSAFAFLDVQKPLESLQAFQKYLEIKILIVEECYLKKLIPSLCSCWKELDRLLVSSNFVIFQSNECKNSDCANSKEYEKCEEQSKIAYVIQTSGTTGDPKVVQVPHDCIASNIVDLRSRFSVTKDDVILQSTRITFDPSIVEIFLSLSTGASLVIISDHIRAIPKKLLEVIVRENITIFQGTPSLICGFGESILKSTLLQEDSSLRILAFGGEPCPSYHKLQRLKSSANKTEIFNLYGLTELSCWASCFKIDFEKRSSTSLVPIGEPLLNTKLEILSEDGKITDEGQLFIGGEKRFCIVNDEKWSVHPEQYMRPTGDLAYKSSDGSIYIEGRNDSIIKNMGHKVSLQLVNCIVEKISQIVNHFLHFDSETSRLYLFFVRSDEDSFQSELEEKLMNKLKEAIPCLPPVILVPVAFIPLTKHGKTDVAKLMSFINRAKKHKITNVCENNFGTVSALWKKYTKQTDIAGTDSFILKGGDSIAAIQFSAEIEWKFQTSLPLLVEKVLNESFKDVENYIKLNAKESKIIIENIKSYSGSSESYSQPLTKRKRCDVPHCFKVVCKQGTLKYCNHVENSNSCFYKQPENIQSTELCISLDFSWDLKKCIDATPCILYFPSSTELFIFIGSHFGMFSCIDMNRKSEKWQVLVPDRIESSACVSACGKYILFGCYDHCLYCITIANGAIHWKYETAAEVKSSPSVSLSNVVFVGSHDKHIYAIDVQSGFLIWKYQVAHGSIFSSPAVIESMSAVCVGTLDGILTLLRMDSGDVLWKYNSGKPLFSSPTAISDYILIGSTNNHMLCLDFSGNEKFKYFTEGPIFSSIAYDKDVQDRVVFGCHDLHVYCITLQGNLVWKTLVDSPVYATPFIFKWNGGNYVCTASSLGTIYILHISSGKIIFSKKFPGEIFSSPVILNDNLIIGCRDNNVYCFTLKNVLDQNK